MTGRRDQIRDAELADPRTSARTLNDILRDVQTRLEALERMRFVDVQIVTDSSGVASAVSVAQPSWPVRGVLLLRAWNATTKAPFIPARIGYEAGVSGLSVSLYAGDLSPSTTYQLRLEVRG